MAERLLKLLQDERSGGRGKAVSYATIHAMRPRAQLRRGATLAQESHEGVCVPNCIRPRTQSRNAHAYRETVKIIARELALASIPFFRPPLRDSHWLDLKAAAAYAACTGTACAFWFLGAE